MPDLFTHTLSGYILLKSRWGKYFLPSVFLLGCILPDLVRGPLLIISNFLELNSRQTMPFLILHAPLPLLFQVWLVSLFFEARLRSAVFKNLLSGVFIHLLLDAGQKAYHISYLWLFPFSFKNPIQGLWWADNGLFVTLIFIFLSVLFFFLGNRIDNH